ncbi:hypothetical protein M899_3250 [Bacteriovorax sp. BSW11_IV]|uniref:hypothetical protein n=1 Tax=Bacteriovorax sp. BSW11_IV TaxID=1353529 RepID=UPI000389F8BE|nr:hypothetical protein [Bacteriovorax sp. BSW11_IV]EQC48257.1 hypothetical protein M899_3250 [Bacteriovorax sp. BSW11_IV]
MSLFQIVILFLVITGASSILVNVFNVDYGTVSYWDNRGVFFLIFITIFPRLTLFFSNVVSGGLLWWLGFIFAPRLLVAILATIAYWETNPVLVMFSWIVALSGESTEKYAIKERVVVYKRRSDDIEDVEYRKI